MSDLRSGRRGFLRTVAGTGAVVAVGGRASTAGSRRCDSNGGFPPSGTTEWGAPVELGEGTARTFTTETPSGRPKYHGLYLDRDALEGLPFADELEASGECRYDDKYGREGEALQIHRRWSLEFFLPLPSASSTPFTFLGLNWNPNGHPPVWSEPHFDVHFHTMAPEAVDDIAGPRAPAYDLPDRYVPEGYARSPAVDERVIADMGEHLVDPTVPEMNGGEFANTLIWGAYDADGDGVAEPTFVEPMITRA